MLKNNNKLKKILVYLLTSFISFVFISGTYIFFEKELSVFDNKLRDYLFIFRGEEKNSNNIVIIDIDEKSLSKLGQWPWSRNKVSKLLENLTKANIGLIGFDVVFAEEDRTSPHKILKDLNIDIKDIPNYDNEFAYIIANTPTILGYQFELEKKDFIKQSEPKIPSIVIEKNKSENSNLIKAYGTILNTPLLQENSYSSGFFNNIPDELGMVRSIPLIISFNDIIYPSLSLEIIRIISQVKKIFINYDNNGISSINVGEFNIPTDAYGRMVVNFRGSKRNFKYISALDIYNNNFKIEDIEGKIGLIGTSAAGLLDLRATVFDSVYPGVEVHANAIDNILTKSMISSPSWTKALNICLIFILSFLTIFLTTISKLWIKPIISIAFISFFVGTTYYLLFFEYLSINLLFPLFTIVFTSAFATLVDYFYTIKKEEAIKEKFASKVSKSVMEELLKNPNNNSFQAMQKEITIFFSDVRSFTTISEQMGDAKNLINYLNKYMEPMTNIITKNDGTVDKYIGDAIMAYWNAPIDVQNHADKALNAAIEQIQYLEILNKKLIEEKLPIIDIGIGLNTGLTVAGEMGSTQRSDYTVIGDSVNIASRLESLCKHYDSKINISNYTKEKLKDNYIFRFLDYVQVKGKKEAIEIWQVIDFEKENTILKEELKLYHKAIDLYKTSDFKKALMIFESLNQNPNKSNNKIYDIYISRCSEYIKNPPKNFKGIFTHQEKS